VRGQALPPNLQASFPAFQNHRRNGLPKTLQGEMVTSPPEQEIIPLGFKLKLSDERTAKENPKKIEASSQKEEVSQTEHPRSETDSMLKTPPKLSQMIPPLSSIIPVDIPKTAGETQSTELGSPITSLTPL